MISTEYQDIEVAFNKIDNLNDLELEKLCEKHTLNQPELLEYILSASVEYKNEQLEGLLVYYFCLLMEIRINKAPLELKIDEKSIVAFEDQFLNVINEYFENEKIELLEEYTDQGELVKFMIIEISTPDEDGSKLDEETAVQLFISSIAMIKLLF
ncbi:MAG: hypothetical protein CL824_05030 [Crocinitomicaceae bacterium]|nr:hypothetical protein [Crocinitomicaceae bacterium]